MGLVDSHSQFEELQANERTQLKSWLDWMLFLRNETCPLATTCTYTHVHEHTHQHAPTHK